MDRKRKGERKCGKGKKERDQLYDQKEKLRLLKREETECVREVEGLAYRQLLYANRRVQQGAREGLALGS